MTPFDRYIAAAEGPSGLWRVLLGLLLIGAVWIFVTFVVLGTGWLILIARGAAIPEALDGVKRLMVDGGAPGLAMVLSTFGGIWVGVWAALRLLHRRSVGSLLGRARLGRRTLDFLGGFAIAAGAFAVSLALCMAVGGLPTPTGISAADLLPWLPAVALLVILQAGGEELIFRGYLGQELARRVRTPLVWAALPSLLFGLLHYQAGLGQTLGLLYVLVTFLFGLTACVLVWRTGTLWAAIGLHTGLNLPGLTVVGLDLGGSIPGAQLYVYGAGEALPLFLADAVVSALLLLWVVSSRGPFRGRA